MCVHRDTAVMMLLVVRPVLRFLLFYCRFVGLGCPPNRGQTQYRFKILVCLGGPYVGTVARSVCLAELRLVVSTGFGGTAARGSMQSLFCELCV